MSETEFERVLHLLGEGTTADELSDELRELVVRVRRTGRKGVLTLALHVTAEGDGVVSIADKITVRKPEYARPTRSFDSTSDGHLEPEAVTQPMFDVDDRVIAPSSVRIRRRTDGALDRLAHEVADTLNRAGAAVVTIDGHPVNTSTGEIEDD